MDASTTSRVISDLCALLLAFLPPCSGRHARQVTPAGFASLLFGASFALMVCGSVTFMLGFMLMPWIIGFAMLFWVFGFVSNLNSVWRGVFCPINRSGSGQIFSNYQLSKS
ncbi:hypothetical protein LUZ60_015758 [Juncus effusus]|nr:hypothetical protein LUZ60_015758 [Juncus effusus]